jgi:hypothetical protein
MRAKPNPRHTLNQLHRAIAGIACVALGTLAATEVAAQPRTCVRAMIEEPFVLPDGSEHPAGLLRICLDRAYSPVAGLHTIVAGDHVAGKFLSRRMKPEGVTSDSPQVAFVRDAAGALWLRGYTLTRGDAVEAYWIAPPRERRTVVRAPSPTASNTETVWLAAAAIP